MAAFSSLIMGVGLATSLAGSFMQASAQSKMAKEQSAASKRAEDARQQQMQLDASRRRRQAVRDSMLARSQAMAVGTAQGASQGSSVAGAMAQATATGFQNQQTTQSAEILGAEVFSANRAYADATAKGTSKMAWGGAISSLGGMLMNNAGTLNRLGTYYTQRPYSTPQYG